MNELFSKLVGMKVCEAEFQISDKSTAENIITVRAVDEGAGHFIEIETSGKARIDIEDLIILAKDCAKLCKKLDEQN